MTNLFKSCNYQGWTSLATCLFFSAHPTSPQSNRDLGILEAKSSPLTSFQNCDSILQQFQKHQTSSATFHLPQLPFFPVVPSFTAGLASPNAHITTVGALGSRHHGDSTTACVVKGKVAQSVRKKICIRTDKTIL